MPQEDVLLAAAFHLKTRLDQEGEGELKEMKSIQNFLNRSRWNREIMLPVEMEGGWLDQHQKVNDI